MGSLQVCHTDEPIQSSACRAAAALAECHAYWDAAVSYSSGQGHSPRLMSGGGPTSAEDRALLGGLARALQVCTNPHVACPLDPISPHSTLAGSVDSPAEGSSTQRRLTCES